MIDFNSIDSSVFNKMAMLLGISFILVIIIGFLLVKLLEVIKLPNSLIKPIVSLSTVGVFLYLVAILGDKFM